MCYQHALVSKLLATSAVVVSTVIFSGFFPGLVLLMKLTEALMLGMYQNHQPKY